MQSSGSPEQTLDLLIILGAPVALMVYAALHLAIQVIRRWVEDRSEKPPYESPEYVTILETIKPEMLRPYELMQIANLIDIVTARCPTLSDEDFNDLVMTSDGLSSLAKARVIEQLISDVKYPDKENPDLNPRPMMERLFDEYNKAAQYTGLPRDSLDDYIGVTHDSYREAVINAGLVTNNELRAFERNCYVKIGQEYVQVK